MSRRRSGKGPMFWADRLCALPKTAYAGANQATIRAAAAGGELGSGARMVVNISSAHVPSFCRLSKQGDPRPYLNTYDLKKRVGDHPGPSERRKRVDAALPLPPGVRPEDVYFGAVELTGAGIRYYGDFCFVLRPDAVPDDTVLLESNSYDLEREPLVSTIDRSDNPTRKRQKFARAMSGRWGGDLGSMAVSKVFQTIGERDRRLTLGQIAEAVRDDEDYVEVIKQGSFDADHLEEVRLRAADAALEAQITERLRIGPPPTFAEVQWRLHRRKAEVALRDLGVPTRVVTTSGRTRSA